MLWICGGYYPQETAREMATQILKLLEAGPNGEVK